METDIEIFPILGSEGGGRGEEGGIFQYLSPSKGFPLHSNTFIAEDAMRYSWRDLKYF
jgi:hypothetical protein